ncbi:MAG TPA: NADP-dependent oxidoreductase [Cellulomonas sp.]
MRAVRYHEYGGPEVLVVEEAPEPHAGPGAIRVRTLAVSVNPVDWKLRGGHARGMIDLTFPVIPGRDAVGIVDELGEGVTDVAIGDRVFGLGGVSDTTAEHAVLTAWATAPAQWSVEQAAAAGLASVTAVRGLAVLGDLEGRTLLVEGASGAVGGAAAAVALSRGARVIGTASARHHDALRADGVVPTTYGPGLTERVRELAPDGIDLALDAAGAGSLGDLVTLTGDPSRVVTVADFTAEQHGVRLVNAENEHGPLRVAAELGAAGRYTPWVGTVLPLEEARTAHELAQSGSAGKVVLVVAS